jgi:intein/homing endonuclease
MNTDSLDFAYLLGVYLTDGSVYKGMFRLNSIDYDFMDRVANILQRIVGRRPNIRKMKKRSKNHSDAWEMAIMARNLTEFLEEETNKKHRVPYFVFEKPLDWQKEFLAGVLDGDGWISITESKPNKKTGHVRKSAKIGFVGVKDSYMRDMQKLLTKMEIKHSYRDRKRSEALQEMREYTIRPRDFVESRLYFRVERKVKKTIIMINERIGLQLDTFRD